MKTFKHGDKVRVTMVFDGELVHDSDGPITEEQFISMIYNDDSYGLKSIVVGRLLSETNNDDHDTELLWKNTTVKVSKAR